MPLDRHAKRFLDMVAVGGIPRTSDITPESMREAMLRLGRVVDAKDVPIDRIESRELPGPGGALPVRIYTPVGAVDSGAGCIVYFHGGAGVFCGIETHDGLCRMLANGSGCRVVSVGYRLAPEHPYSAAVEDGYFATVWVSEHAVELGIDSSRIVVAGDSAGGTLATVVCQLALERGGPPIALQLLLCPVTDLSVESRSRRTFGEGYFIDRTILEWAKGLCCPAGVDLRDPRISPLCAPELAGLPPAHIHTAEFDPMHDEGKAYADALAAAGVTVHYVPHEGMIHHFYCMGGVIPAARTAIGEAAAAILDALAPLAGQAPP